MKISIVGKLVVAQAETAEEGHFLLSSATAYHLKPAVESTLKSLGSKHMGRPKGSRSRPTGIYDCGIFGCHKQGLHGLVGVSNHVRKFHGIRTRGNALNYTKKKSLDSEYAPTAPSPIG